MTVKTSPPCQVNSEPKSDRMNNQTLLKTILTISASRSLTGAPISKAIAKDWIQASSTTAKQFDNQGFDVDLKDFDQSVNELRALLRGTDYDGVIVGWCLRGFKERTVMFEQIVAACVEELRAKPKTRLMFCAGPDDLYATTMRHFG